MNTIIFSHRFELGNDSEQGANLGPSSQWICRWFGTRNHQKKRDQDAKQTSRRRRGDHQEQPSRA